MDFLKPSVKVFNLVALVPVLRAIGMVIATAIVISGGTSNSDSNSISDSNGTRSQFKRSRFVSMNPYEGIFPPPRRFSPCHAPAEPEVARGTKGEEVGEKAFL